MTNQFCKKERKKHDITMLVEISRRGGGSERFDFIFYSIIHLFHSIHFWFSFCPDLVLSPLGKIFTDNSIR